MLFGRLLDHLPRPLVIDAIGTTFPDCRATDGRTNKPVCIEFELKSSHFFRDHENRKEKCHWIVCWHNDTKPRRRTPRIIALDKIVEKVEPGFILNRLPKTASPAQRFDFKAARLSPAHGRIIRRLLDFDWSGVGLAVTWPETNGECFTVREPGGIEYFKVGSDGTLGVPFSRWRDVPERMRSRLKDRLNAAARSDWFTGQGKRSRDVVELLRKPSRVPGFIDVWSRFADQRANNRLERAGFAGRSA